MCLILFAWKIHPEHPLIVAANRDEFYERPTSAASEWDHSPKIVAGKDLRAGGTWLGITDLGRFAAITNYRDLTRVKEGAPSRGMLTLDFLQTDLSPADYLSAISAVGSQYNGFNLVLGDRKELYYYSNIENQIRPLSPGVYGLSNHLLDSPWPKVVNGKRSLTALLNETDLSDRRLLQVLSSRDVVDDEHLPNTGIPLEWERALSALHIDMEEYGTVSSTILKTTVDGYYFYERSYNKPSGPPSDLLFNSKWKFSVGNYSQ